MGGVSASISDSMGTTGGKGGFGPGTPQGPQMGFGMDPTTGLPFGQDGMQQPTQQPQGYDGPRSGIFNTMPTQQPQVLQQAGNIMGGNPMGFGGGGKSMQSPQAQQVLQQAGNIMGGNPMGFGGQLPPNVQMGFGMPPSGGYNSPLRTQLPPQAPMQAQPINRFAPPNAAGVRSQPAANRFTRTRAKR